MSVRAPSPAAVRAALGAQAKVTVGPVGDSFEQEADRVADAVVTGAGQAAPAPGVASPPVEGNGAVQRAAVTPASTAESATIDEERKKKEKPPGEVQRHPMPLGFTLVTSAGGAAQRAAIAPVSEAELGPAAPATGNVAVPAPPQPGGEVLAADTPGPGGLEGPLAGGMTMPADAEPGISEDDLFARAETFQPIAIAAGGAIADPVGAAVGSGATGGADGAGDAGGAPAGSVGAAPAGPGAGPTSSESVQRAEQPTGTADQATGGLRGPNQAELDGLRSPSGGEPVPEDVRTTVGVALGAGFDHIQVHRGPDDAAQTARLGARAFTLGPHIWLGKGESAHDLRLMAHELTHVAQQGHAAQPRGPPPVPGPTERPDPARATDAAVTGPVSRAPETIRVRGPPDLTVVRRLGFRDLVPDIALNAAAGVADKIPGYRLLSFALAQNPVTGQAVPRTGVTLLNALEPILPERVVSALRDSGAADRAVEWFATAMAKLDLSLTRILGLLSDAALAIVRGAEAVVEVFLPFLRDIRNFVVGAVTTIFELLFEAALSVAGGGATAVMAFLRRARSVVGLIIAHPGSFVQNLLNAVGGGLKRFVSNIGRHLREGFVAWLTGTLAEAGVQLPDKWDLRGIIGLGLQLLGLTWANIRRKLVRQLEPNGERKVGLIEKGVAIVRQVIEGGIASVVPLIIGQLTNLLDKLTSGIVDFVIQKVATEALGYLSGLLTGGLGTLIQVARKIYEVVLWVLDVFQRVQAMITTVVDALERIATGDLEPAAGAIESTLARFVPILIGLLAGLLGLGDLPKKIRNLIQRLSAPVDRLLDKVVGWIVTGARKLISAGRAAAQAAISWFKRRFPVEGGGEQHTLSFDGPPPTTRVMLESTPTELAHWLADRVEEVREGTQLATFVADVKAKQVELQAAIDAASARDDESAQRIVTKGEAVQVALAALLKVVESPSELPLSAEPTFPEVQTIKVGAESVTVGKKMTVAPLSAAGPMGSGVNNDSALWERLRRRPEGNRTFWIQAHFLNNNVHGSGSEQRNLTPFSQAANQVHERKVESKVKDVVLQKVPAAGGGGPAVPVVPTPRPPVVKYEVEAHYPSSPGPFPAMPPDVNPLVRETLDVERYLAERFVCRAWYMTRDQDGKWVPGDTLDIGDGIVPNAVSPPAFTLGAGGGGRPRFVAGDGGFGPARVQALRAVPGVDALLPNDAIAQAVLRAATGQRYWASVLTLLISELTALAVPNAGAMAGAIISALRDDTKTVLYEAPAPTT